MASLLEMASTRPKGKTLRCVFVDIYYVYIYDTRCGYEMDGEAVTLRYGYGDMVLYHRVRFYAVYGNVLYI